MNTDTESLDDNLTYQLFQFAVWMILFLLIVFRACTFNVASNSWIWIINYAGMGFALVNLLIKKCFQLRSRSHKKYKPLVGFTIFVLIILCVSSLGVYKLQMCGYSQPVNDIITLLALFFSLSGDTWNKLLNIIIRFLK